MKMKKLYGVEVPDCYPINSKGKWGFNNEEYHFENNNLKTIEANLEYLKQFLTRKVTRNTKKVKIDSDCPIDISKLAQENKIPLDKISVSVSYEKEYGYYDSVDVLLELTISELSYEDNAEGIRQLKEQEQYKKNWLLCQPYFEKVQAARNELNKKKEIKELESKLKKLKDGNS